MTQEEKYKAKLESNKQKRREKAAAKKVVGTGSSYSKVAVANEENEIIQKQLQKRKKGSKAAELSILNDSGKLGALKWNQLYNELTLAQQKEYKKIRDSK